MAELSKKEIYACSLPMPTPDLPICSEWVEEIARVVDRNKDGEIYLVGHSLGVRAILRYFEIAKQQIAGAVLVSGRVDESPHKEVASFGGKPFDFEKIKANCKKFTIIHGDNDPFVPVENAYILAKGLGVEPIIIKNGQHLNESAGFFTLPECLEALKY